MAYRCTTEQGNLLDVADATFVVNASNTRLTLGTGVSMAFKRHCGQGLVKEMLDIYEKVEKPIQQGTVFATSSAEATNFKYALHATVMHYNPGTRYEDKVPTLSTINEILENVEGYLSWYAEKSATPMKLVLPLMGCGVGGLDKTDVAKLYKAFFTRSVAFECEVVVYGYTDEDYERITAVCASETTAHDSWSNYYDFVNEESFGAFVKNLTNQTLTSIQEVLPQRHHSIIDFGAGTGRLSIPLSTLGYTVTAVEPSSGMLEVLQAKAQTLKLEVHTVQTTIQNFKSNEKYDLGVAVFTVLGYLSTESALESAAKVMADVIKEGGFMLVDVASRVLFNDSHVQTPCMDREIQLKPIDNERYEYIERCSGTHNGRSFKYEDQFVMRNWSPETVIEQMQKQGFVLQRELNDFSFSGATYLLFEKVGNDVNA